MGEARARGGADLRELSAALGDRANALAAEGRRREIPSLWEQAISGLSDNSARAQLTTAYAWYQVLHHAIPEGVALAANLLLDSRTPGPAQAQARVLIRSRWRAEPGAVEAAWEAAADAPLPRWARLADEEIRAVADWVSAPTWGKSQDFYGEHAGRLQTKGAAEALDELALRGPAQLTSAVAVHRALLALAAGALGADGAYRCLGDAEVAQAAAASAIGRAAWGEVHACGMIEVLTHRRTFLGSVHLVIAQAMEDAKEASDSRLLARLSAMAKAAPAGERSSAAADARLFAVQSPDHRLSAGLLRLTGRTARGGGRPPGDR
jgi:hypothetical protein